MQLRNATQLAVLKAAVQHGGCVQNALCMLAQVCIAHATAEAVAAGLRIEAQQKVAIKAALIRAQLADDSRVIEGRGHERLLFQSMAPPSDIPLVAAVVLIGCDDGYA
jgi:hypothetical protein